MPAIALGEEIRKFVHALTLRGNAVVVQNAESFSLIT